MTRIVFIGFALALGGAVSAALASGTGWSCRTCGFSNGTQLTGMALEVTGKPVAAIILTSSAKITAR